MNNREIKIDHLTQEQKDMLDIMWSIESYEDYEEWIDSISFEEAKMADDLTRLLIVELSDFLVEEEIDQARDYLKKFQLQK